MELEVAGLNARQSRTLSVWEDHFAKVLDQNERDKVHEISKLQRLRRNGCRFLHSQPVLLLVVILNCIDCILVLSELALDLHFVKDMILTAEHTMKTFNQLLVDRYPDHFVDIPIHDAHKFYNMILRAELILKSHINVTGVVRDSYRTVRDTSNHGLENEDSQKVFQDDHDPAFLDEDHLSVEESIAHAFHKTSITILGILVLFTVLRIFCHGLSFVKHKLEVFDGIIVVASFTLDVCFINGLTIYPVESFLLILAFMIPWRVIRVLNSLVIAVKDNFHFLLKLMFKKNRCLSEKLESMKTENTRNLERINVLTSLCKSHGITLSQIANQYDQRILRSGNKMNTNVHRKRGLPIGACFQRQVSDGSDCIQAYIFEEEPLCTDNHMEVIQESDGDNDDTNSEQLNESKNNSMETV